MTFSFRPTSVSTAPARAASVSTLVVSWKLAAEMNDSLCSDALVMPSSSVLPRAGLGRLPLAGSLPAASAASLASLNSALGTTSPSLKSVPPGSAIFSSSGDQLVALAEAELVDHLAGQELGVAGVFDLHLAEHLVEDDLDVLVVDLHALRAVDVLHFGQQVLVQRLFALDAQDVVRDDRPADQRVAGLDVVAGVDLQLLVLRDVVLALHAGFVA